MTTVAPDQLSEPMQALKDAAETALRNENTNDFETFERYLNEVATFVREQQQAMWSDEAKRAIRNLETGKPLSGDDREVIRTFLVSDAERYLAHENNYDDWRNELQRLVNDLARRATTLDRHTIADLRGVLKDAIRLVPDIRNYLDERVRVEKFKQALQTLDKPSRDMLVGILKEQLRSATR